jgi:hypothetical protein
MECIHIPHDLLEQIENICSRYAPRQPKETLGWPSGSMIAARTPITWRCGTSRREPERVEGVRRKRDVRSL